MSHNNWVRECYQVFAFGEMRLIYAIKHTCTIKTMEIKKVNWNDWLTWGYMDRYTV